MKCIVLNFTFKPRLPFYSYEGSVHKKSASSLDKPYYDDEGYDRYRHGYDQDDQPYDERYDDGADAYNNRYYDDDYRDDEKRPYDDDRKHYDDDRYSDDRGRYTDEPRRYSDDRGRYDDDEDDGGFRDGDRRPSDRDDHYYPDDDKNYEPYQKRGYDRTPSYEKRPMDDVDYDQYREPGKFDSDGNPISTRPRPAPSGANGSGHVPGTSSFV